MNKALIGLILFIVGILICVFEYSQSQSLVVCSITYGIGIILALVGLTILIMRFRVWGYT